MSGNNRIVIVEDDGVIRQELAIFLSGNGYEVLVISDFENVLERLLEMDANLVLLDINLPGMDGATILKMYRKEKNTPVIMVTSKEAEMDELICMSFGADDYIRKPYNPTILLFHIEAVLRRSGVEKNDGLIRFAGVTFDAERLTLTCKEQSVELSKNEGGILRCLLRAKGKIVSRDAIMSDLWESCDFVDDNTLTVNITRIRRKLSDLGCEDVIRTKRGQGYYIEVH